MDRTYDYKTAAVSLATNGVLTVRLHSRGGPLRWGALPHTELADLFARLAGDDRVRAVVLTGTGDAFIGLPAGDLGALARGELPTADWDRVVAEGERLVHGLLAIPAPTVAAVNGPATAHSELAVLCDLVLAAPTASFSDAAHAPIGLVPGDGMQIVWPLLLGPNRGRWFLLTGQVIGADEALRLGVVGEIVPADRLGARAAELAADLAGRNPVTMRATRHVLTRALRRAMTEDLRAGLVNEAFAATSGREWSPAAGSSGPPKS